MIYSLLFYHLYTETSQAKKSLDSPLSSAPSLKITLIFSLLYTIIKDIRLYHNLSSRFQMSSCPCKFLMRLSICRLLALCRFIMALVIAIDVDNVTAVFKRPVQFFDDPVDMVAVQAMLPDIVFCNKDDVAFRQLFIIASLFRTVETL